MSRGLVVVTVLVTGWVAFLAGFVAGCAWLAGSRRQRSAEARILADELTVRAITRAHRRINHPASVN